MLPPADSPHARSDSGRSAHPPRSRRRRRCAFACIAGKPVLLRRTDRGHARQLARHRIRCLHPRRNRAAGRPRAARTPAGPQDHHLRRDRRARRGAAGRSTRWSRLPSSGHHRRPIDVAAAQDWCTGSGRRWARHGHPYAAVAEGNLTIQSGETAMEQLLADQPDLDWVFAANDQLASGALRVRRAAQADQRCAARRGDGSRASRRS